MKQIAQKKEVLTPQAFEAMIQIGLLVVASVEEMWGPEIKHEVFRHPTTGVRYMKRTIH